jgi:hypothetical protein
LEKSQKISSIRKIAEEFRPLRDLVRNNRYFSPVVLLIIFLVAAAFLNFSALKQESSIAWVLGEKPLRANFTPEVRRQKGLFQGESVEILSDKLPPAERYYSIEYRFKIQKSGRYTVLVAGTPPGSLTTYENEWFSPYQISFDKGEFHALSYESLLKSDPSAPPPAGYSSGGYYWTRVAKQKFEKGWHTLEIRLDQKRLRDGKYALYVDTIAFVPEGYRPKRVLEDLDPKFFSD